MPHVFHIHPLFYTIEGMKVSYFCLLIYHFTSFRIQDKCVVPLCKSVLILLLFMRKNCFYLNRLFWDGTLLCEGNNSIISSFFEFRWLGVSWFTMGCLLDTSLCLSFRTAFALEISFLADSSMFAVTLTAPMHCSQVSIFIPKILPMSSTGTFELLFFPNLTAMFV